MKRRRPLQFTITNAGCFKWLTFCGLDVLSVAYKGTGPLDQCFWHSLLAYLGASYDLTGVRFPRRRVFGSLSASPPKLAFGPLLGERESVASSFPEEGIERGPVGVEAMTEVVSVPRVLVGER